MNENGTKNDRFIKTLAFNDEKRSRKLKGIRKTLSRGSECYLHQNSDKKPCIKLKNDDERTL